VTDAVVAGERQVIFEFARFVKRPPWTARTAGADRFLMSRRKDSGLAHSAVRRRACALAGFYEFLVVRYQGDIQSLAGHVIEQVIDEFNRPAAADHAAKRVPPSEAGNRCAVRVVAGRVSAGPQVPASDA